MLQLFSDSFTRGGIPFLEDFLLSFLLNGLILVIQDYTVGLLREDDLFSLVLEHNHCLIAERFQDPWDVESYMGESV